MSALSTRLLCFLSALTLAGCLVHPTQLPPSVVGPDLTSLPLYRSGPNGDKIFVEARLHDGVPRIFLVDTGASISVLSAQIASELDLEIARGDGHLVGLSGMTPWHATKVETLRIGPYRIADVPFAVGVAGVPRFAGLVPLAGILGNDIWGHFQMSIDYPANQLELTTDGSIPVPLHAQPIFFDGRHPITQTVILLDGEGGPIRESVLLEIDTGARGLLLMGTADPQLEALATTGVEPIVGIGAGDNIPPNAFLRVTRRLTGSGLEVGGLSLDGPFPITWLPRINRQMYPTVAGMPGLLGYSALRNHRVLLDFPGRRFALLPTRGKQPENDVHVWYLDRLQRKGTDPLDTVRVLLWLGRDHEAFSRLDRLVRQRQPRADAQVLRARLLRRSGRTSDAVQSLRSLTFRDLIENDEFVAWVNSLWLEGNHEEALASAVAATILEPESESTWTALSDVLMAKGDYAGARSAIGRAVQLEGNPDAHLLRRGSAALLDSDTYAAMAHFRRLIDIHPAGGFVQWLYSTMDIGTQETELITQDLLRAEQRLHPGMGPLDFMAGAWRQLGQNGRAEDYMKAGIVRDCEQATSPESRSNCQAWYRALGGSDLALAVEQINAALQAQPNRAEYLDTQAMILEAMGDTQGALKSATRAAAHAPDDVYLLIQALRLHHAVRLESAPGSVSSG